MIITYKIEIGNSGIENFSELVKEVFGEMMKCGQEIIKQQLENMDDALMETRDKKRYRCKGSRNTSVKTRLGVIEYNRRIYFDKERTKHVYLLDENISAQSIGQIDSDMCSNIAEMSCVMPFRKVSEALNENTGLNISHQTVWNIVQQMGKEEINETENLAKLSKENRIIGDVETKLLYEEADGDWLKLQGRDRKKHGASKEMKIGIAYDGVIHHKSGKKIRRELDNKVAYASFETAKKFNQHKEAVIASRYNVDEIELRIKNGDGANWIQKSGDCDCICVLDKYHRNKKLTECVSDKKMAENLRELLHSGQYGLLLEAIEGYSNSIEDKVQAAKLRELHSYYSENFEALPEYYERGIPIPETRKPGVVHHANLGSMESNVFTLIGNRMKGGRACWSISGGNNLAALLCRYHTTGIRNYGDFYVVPKSENPPLSSTKIKKTSGKGYIFSCNVTFPSSMKWLKNLAHHKPLSDLNW